MEYRISEKMKNIKPSAIREIFKSLLDPTIISFAAGNPSPLTFPAEEIAALSDKIYSETPTLALQYGITEGYAPLIEKVQGRMREKFNIGREFDKTIITTGGQQGIDLTCKVMCDEGDVVLCEKPSFIGALNAFKANGAVPVGIDMEDDGINIEKLEGAMKAHRNAKLLYVIPTHHNPLGTTMSQEKREAVYALAKKYGIIILEDNPYGELRFSGDEVKTIKSMDTDGIVVYCSSFSKILAPGIRVGFLNAPETIISKITVAKQVNDVHTNIYFQLICNAYLENYDIDAHIRRINELYKAKCNLMLSEMDKKINRSVKYTRPDGGLFLWCELPSHVDLPSFVRRCLDRKVAVVPGTAFLIDETEKSTSFRLNYSMPSDAQIVEGIGILTECIDEEIKG